MAPPKKWHVALPVGAVSQATRRQDLDVLRLQQAGSKENCFSAVAPPVVFKDEPACDRSSRDKDGPQMPCLSPDRRRAQVQLVMTIAVSDHARPLSKDKAARRHMIARRLLFRTAAHFNTV